MRLLSQWVFPRGGINLVMAILSVIVAVFDLTLPGYAWILVA